MNAETPVILISGFADEALKKIGHMADIYVIHKPFRPEELLRAVSDMMSIPVIRHDHRPHIDAQIMTELISATSEVIKTLTGFAEIDIGKPFLYERSEKNIETDITGLLEMRTVHFQGSIAISFPKDTFLKLVSGLTKKQETKINEKNISHAQVLMRLIYETAKDSLAKKNIDLSTASLQIVSGPKHKLTSYVGQLTMAVPVQTMVGQFYIAVTAS
jgi:CheY-specific phosphatase CheX